MEPTWSLITCFVSGSVGPATPGRGMSSNSGRGNTLLCKSASPAYGENGYFSGARRPCCHPRKTSPRRSGRYTCVLLASWLPHVSWSTAAASGKSLWSISCPAHSTQPLIARLRTNPELSAPKANALISPTIHPPGRVSSVEAVRDREYCSFGLPYVTHSGVEHLRPMSFSRCEAPV